MMASLMIAKLASHRAVTGPAVAASVVVHHHRADLDGAAAELRRRDPRRNLQRLIEILGVDRIVADQRLAGFGERAVGRHRLAVLDPHGRCGRGRLQAVAALEIAALDDRLVNFPYSSIILERSILPLLASFS